MAIPSPLVQPVDTHADQSALARSLAAAERAAAEFGRSAEASEKNPYGLNRKARRRLAAEVRRAERKGRRRK